MSEISSSIYKIKIEGSSKIYIGSAVNFNRRKYRHLHLLEIGTHPNRFLQNSYNKYGGKTAFSMEILELVSNKADLIEREQFYIDSYSFDNLFNLCPSASSTLGRKASKETIEKIRENSLQQYKDGKTVDFVNWWKGKKRSDANCKKIAENNSKRIITQSTRNKISEKNKGKKLSDDHKQAIYTANKGSKRTEETKQNISNSLKGKAFSSGHKENLSKHHSRKRAINQIDAISKEVIQSYDSINAASKKIGCAASSISNCCRKQAKTASGFIWEYKE